MWPTFGQRSIVPILTERLVDNIARCWPSFRSHRTWLAFSSMRSPRRCFGGGLPTSPFFIFVRQQYGWVRLYQARESALSLFDRRLEILLIYLATCFPLLYWHANLPRRFSWFLPGDFVAGVVSEGWVFWGAIFYGLVGIVFLSRTASRFASRHPVSWGKINVIVTTAACWGIGIVTTNSDWAFTVTNIFIHGVPYVAFVWANSGVRQARRGSTSLSWVRYFDCDRRTCPL